MNAKYILAAALLACSAAAQAGIVFSDDFNAETPRLNRTPSNFTLVAGTVDIIGSGPNGVLAEQLPGQGNGYYIDLDGSTRRGGTLRRNLSLNAGVTYTASFDLAGSQRGDTNVVTVRFGSLPPAIFSRASSQPFMTFQLGPFTPVTTGIYALSFANAGGDNRGALLDDVLVTFPTVTTPVSEPESVALLLAGLGMGGWVSRRRRVQHA